VAAQWQPTGKKKMPQIFHKANDKPATLGRHHNACFPKMITLKHTSLLIEKQAVYSVSLSLYSTGLWWQMLHHRDD